MATLLDPDGEVHVGQDVHGRAVTVTPELIDTYRRGTDDDDPRYDTTDGQVAPVAPALLFHSEVYRDLGWYLPEIVGNLHAAQEWELFHPMRVGQEVRSRVTVVERYSKRGRNYIVAEVLFTDAAGRWLQRSRTHQSFLAEQAAEGFVVDKQREKKNERTFVVGECDGPDLDGLDKTITLEMCQAFSGPDKNYHTDREMARALGFPDVVVQGMLSVCFVSELMTRNFGDGWLAGGKMHVKLVNVVWPDDAVRVRGRIRDQVPEGCRTRVHTDVWCEKADGVKTIVGSASALL